MCVMSESDKAQTHKKHIKALPSRCAVASLRAPMKKSDVESRIAAGTPATVEVFTLLTYTSTLIDGT